MRTSISNPSEIAAGNLPKTPTNKHKPTPDAQSTRHVAKALACVPTKRDITYFTTRELQAMLFHKCKASIVGFMNVNTFLDTFLPWQSEPVRISEDAPRFPSYAKGLEKDIYGPFVRISHLFLWLQLI
jgi:hypothetical protein